MRIATAFFAFIFLILHVSICCGQTQGIFFNRLSAPYGSYFGPVSGITQDPKGYIWIASINNGFFRYDGHGLTNYRNDPANPNSLSNNWFESIYTHSTGIIWLGTWGNGLDRFDPATGIFTHYSHDPKKPSSLAQDLVPAIYEDKEGEQWIGTHGSLDLMDRKTGTFKHFRHDQHVPSSLSNDQVRVIYEDKQGTLWVGTGSPWQGAGGRPGEAGLPGEGGLNRLNRRTGKFTRYMHDDKDLHSLAQNKVGAIFEDSHDNFWIGTTGEDGLQIMNRAKGTFQRYVYDSAHPEKLSRSPVNKQINYDRITFITEDAAGSIWIGTAGAGLNRYDPVTQKIKHYSYKDSADGFADNTAWSHYNSRDGTLWIGSFWGNLYYGDLFHTNIPYFKLGKNTLALFEDRKGAFWIDIDSGIIQKDNNTGKTQLFANDSLKNISGIVKDAADNIWIGVYGSGLYKFDLQTQTFTNYRNNTKNNNSLVSNEILGLYADAEGNIWIGTTNGFDAMNIKTGKFTHYRNNSKDGDNRFNIINAIAEDSQGQIWTGTQVGITRMDKKTGKIKYYPLSNNVYNIYKTR
jgi:ligand-binding sensor domain-containing protein